MKKVNRKNWTRLSTASLAAVIALGGAGLVPANQAQAASASVSYSSVSLDFLSDSVRTELIRLNNERAIAFALVGSSVPNSSQSNKMFELRDKAYALTMNPSASQAQLTSLKNEYRSALDAYEELYLDKTRILNHLASLRSTLEQQGNALNTVDRVRLQAVYDAYIYLGAASGTTRDYLSAFRIFADGSTRSNNLAAYDAAKYTKFVSDSRAAVNTELERIKNSSVNHSASVDAFARAASVLERAASSNYGMNIVNMAEGDLKLKYEAVLKELKADKANVPTPPPVLSGQALQLSNEIAQARGLLALPKGIRSGQYPQSAFGDLRRTINEVSRVLKKAKTEEELSAARTKLANAVNHFKSRKKP